jgi:hypothetical protein
MPEIYKYAKGNLDNFKLCIIIFSLPVFTLTEKEWQINCNFFVFFVFLKNLGSFVFSHGAQFIDLFK